MECGPVKRGAMERRQSDPRPLPGRRLASAPWMGAGPGQRCGSGLRADPVRTVAQAGSGGCRRRKHSLRVRPALHRRLARDVLRSCRVGLELLVEARLDSGVAHEMVSTSSVSPPRFPPVAPPPGRRRQTSQVAAACGRARQRDGRRSLHNRGPPGRGERAALRDSTPLAINTGRPAAAESDVRAWQGEPTGAATGAARPSPGRSRDGARPSRPHGPQYPRGALARPDGVGLQRGTRRNS